MRLLALRALPLPPALLLLAIPSAAQARLGEMRKDHLPLGSGSTVDAVALDVEGDGDLDWLVASFASGSVPTNRLYLNDGTGTFTDGTEGRLPSTMTKPFAIAAGDVDGDGDTDLVLGGNRQRGLFRNSGNGVFTDTTVGSLPASQDATQAVELGDVDGDGDLDLVFGNWDDALFPGSFSPAERLLLNSGAGTFTSAPPGSLVSGQNTYALALVDVDLDHDLDLVVGNAFEGGVSGQDRLFRNNGSGVFTDVTAGFFPTDNTGTQALAIGDVDGDGRPDVALGNQDPLGNPQLNRLYRNVGAGRFEDATSARMPLDPPPDVTQDLVLADVTGDGAPDLFIGNIPPAYTTGSNRLYVNDGAGKFFDGSFRLPDGSPRTKAVTAADVDSDGDVDLLAANEAPLRHQLFFNDGAGHFADGTARPVPQRWAAFLARDLALGDLDGDGDQDLVVANVNRPNELFLGDGRGRFEDATANMPPEMEFTTGVRIGDVDLDGDRDLFFADNGGNSLYVNDGQARFTDESALRLPPGGNPGTSDTVLDDVDGDGDPDLIHAFEGQPKRLLRNDGDGFFSDDTAGKLPPDTDATHALAFGDVDGDGDGDLVLGNRESTGQQSRLYENDGAGTFTDATASRLPVLLEATRSVVLGDVDADGDLDLLQGNDLLGPGTGQNRLLANDGAGFFTDLTATQLPLRTGSTSRLVLADLDLDGDPDLVVVGLGLVYLNDGQGVFQDAAPGLYPTTLPSAVADIDTDGDPDLVPFANLVYQLAAPLVARIGQRYQLDVYSRGDVAPASLAWIRLDPAAAPHVPHAPPPALALAELAGGGVSPSFVVLPIPQPAGFASTTIAIPNEPALAGTVLSVRARFVNPASGLQRASNLVREVIWP